MKRLMGHIRKPVLRTGGETYVLYTLLSFGASVALTRLFLEITGYPQLGGGSLHIAHVLWGGLVLFGAALLPLIYSNRWAYTWGSVLAGIGVGLFIDEVGKFITQNNDYFFPGAAPIVYAFFLITVLIYLQMRKPRKQDPRAELYRALDGLGEVLDHDLEPDELIRIEQSLLFVIENSDSDEYVRLARELLEFLTAGGLRLTPEIPSFLERLYARWAKFESHWLGRARLKAILMGGLIGLGVFVLFNLGRQIYGTDFSLLSSGNIGDWLGIEEGRNLLWLLFRMLIEGAVAILLIVAAFAFLLKRENLGVVLSFFSLLLSLTVINLFVFYFEQFSTIILAIVQLLLLIGVLRYRSSFLVGARGA